MLPLSVLFFLIIEQSVLMVLVFYEKCMLEKVTMQRTPQIADFNLSGKNRRKNPVKGSACVVSLKIAIECGIHFSKIRLFLENHSLEFNEIWHKNTLGNK